MPRSRSFVTIFTASVGGLLEMYDFTIYAFLAPTLSQLFFAHSNERMGIIFTFAIFAAGYLVRPIGGILFGHLGDRSGRKAGLIATISLMGGATFLMGCLPTYHHIGLTAPILLLALRLFQGIAVGGDLPGGMTYLSEQASPPRRGRYLGYLFASINFGTLLAAFAVFGLQRLLSDADFQSWGWRIPFWSSLILSLAGLLQRRELPESSAFKNMKQQQQVHCVPVVSLFKSHKRMVLKALLLMAPFVVIICQIFLYGPTFLNHFLQLPYEKATQYNTLGLAALTISFLFCGRLADRLGSERMLCLTFALLFAAPYVYYTLLDMQFWLTATLSFSVICGTCCMGLLYPFSQLFDTSVRYTGIAFVYNTLFAVGGSIPALLTTYIPNMPTLSTLPLLLFLLTTLLFAGSLLIHRKG